jgi:hypothetical protein
MLLPAVFAGILAFDGVHTNDTMLAVVLLLASRLWQTLLLLLASFKLLIVSCCWSLCYCWRSCCNQWCFGISAVPFEHAVAGGPAVTGFPAVEGVLAVACVPADLL